MKIKLLKGVSVLLILSGIWNLGIAAEFSDGPVIFGYGKHAPVKQDVKIEKNMPIKVVFDISQVAKDGVVNQQINSVARFLNMHVANGISEKNIQLAIVVHGGASNEMLGNKAFFAKYGKENPNTELISALLKNNVKIVQCGQSAAYHEIAKQDMIDGVDVALSAMTAHAILAFKGYSQNPF